MIAVFWEKTDRLEYLLEISIHLPTWTNCEELQQKISNTSNSGVNKCSGEINNLAENIIQFSALI
jgi:hypothetical protein